MYVGATIDRLLIGAEEGRIQKMDKSGTLRDISLSDIYSFEKAGMNKDKCSVSNDNLSHICNLFIFKINIYIFALVFETLS